MKTKLQLSSDLNKKIEKLFKFSCANSIATRENCLIVLTSPLKEPLRLVD